MKKYQSFLSENVQFLEVKFSIYLNRRVFVMKSGNSDFKLALDGELRQMILINVCEARTYSRRH